MELSVKDFETIEELDEKGASRISSAFNSILRRFPSSPIEQWQLVVTQILRPDHPFAVHKLLYMTVYTSWNAEKMGPPPCWIPTKKSILSTNAAEFMKSFQGGPIWDAISTGDPARDWPLLQRLSYHQPELFWPPVLKVLGVTFAISPHKMLESDGIYDPDQVRWFPGARMNVAECALLGRGSDVEAAIVWADEKSPKQLHIISRKDLRQRSLHVATALCMMGLHPGDGCAIVMPMTPDCIAIYLGIILAGCTVISIADSFSPSEIEARLRIGNAVVVFTQDVVARGGKVLPLYHRVATAIKLLPSQHSVRAIVQTSDPTLVSTTQGDGTLTDFMYKATKLSAHAVYQADAYSPTNILFSSGTTGEPKAIPWNHITPIRAGTDGYFHQDIHSGEVVCWPTSIGWMMGPWLVYATLLNGATMALFQGSPTGRPFGEFVAAAKVTCLGLVPSIAAVWRSTSCMKDLDWSCLKTISSTGEASAPEDYLWLSGRVKGYCPIIEYCGGTEIGGGYMSGIKVFPQAPSLFTTPTVGACPVILDSETGALSPHGDVSPVIGEVALAVPMLGVSQSLMNRNHKKVYYEGMPPYAKGIPLRRHGDEMERLKGGLGMMYRARGRTDDAMNLGGIKVGSLELEQAVMNGVEGVVETAAVGVPTPGGGPERLVLFVVGKKGMNGGEKELLIKCRKAVASLLNPLFRVDQVVIKDRLPRTASNKIMRRELREEAVKMSSSARSKL